MNQHRKEQREGLLQVLREAIDDLRLDDMPVEEIRAEVEKSLASTIFEGHMTETIGGPHDGAITPHLHPRDE